jgi:crotonobetainyl-CoA:carnitine CoA-transferase CaiB-like acyl-CoA transferase
MQSTHSTTALPLDGVLIVSLEQALAAPLCTCRLADAGARVIKIERPEGDFARGYDSVAAGMSSYFAWTNRGKESIVLNFKDSDDLALLHGLLSRADVVVQNLAAGALARVGLDSASLRKKYPRLITCDIGGYGSASEVAHLKAYDLLVQCESGLVSVSGSPEGQGRVGVSICDIGAGLNAAFSVMLALRQREITGTGSGLSISLFDSAAEWMTVPYLHNLYGQGAPKPVGLKHPSIAPYGAFHTADSKQIVISVQNEREWQTFCTSVLENPGLLADERFSSNNARVANREALDAVLKNSFSAWSLAEAIERLKRGHIAFGQVRSVEELAEHPALRIRSMKIDGQTINMVASPICAEWETDHFPSAPKLGEHSSVIRKEFTA